MYFLSIVMPIMYIIVRNWPLAYIGFRRFHDSGDAVLNLKSLNTSFGNSVRRPSNVRGDFLEFVVYNSGQ